MAMAEMRKGEKTGDIAMGSQSLSEVRDVISTGCAGIDRATGVGGLACGRVHMAYGAESSGKTTFGLQCIAEAQRRGGFAIMVDAEHKLDKAYMESLGVDLSSLIILYPDYLEQMFRQLKRGWIICNQIKKKRRMDFPVITVIDSITAMESEQEVVARGKSEGEKMTHTPATHARSISTNFRHFQKTVNRLQPAVLLISQIREKIGVMFGSNETTTGGRAPRFYSSMVFKFTRTKTEKKAGLKVGSSVRVVVDKNQLKSPFQEAHEKIYYGAGFDQERSVLTELRAVKLVKQRGDYLYIANKKLENGIDKSAILVREKEWTPKLVKFLRDHHGWMG